MTCGPHCIIACFIHVRFTLVTKVFFFWHTELTDSLWYARCNQNSFGASKKGAVIIPRHLAWNWLLLLCLGTLKLQCICWIVLERSEKRICDQYINRSTLKAASAREERRTIWFLWEKCTSMHYRLRSIEGGQFRLVNFAPHFIRVQIFQIDFPLILSASKYFRYISLSFYICRGQNEHFSINSVRKKGRIELFQIFHPNITVKLVHKYLQKTNSNFQTLISPWSRPRWATLFWAFFPGMAYIFILQKIVAQRDRLHLFCTFPAILVKYSAPTSSNFFLCKIWTMTNSKSAANITWWVWWMRNRGLLLTFFGPFLTPLDALTHSAMEAGGWVSQFVQYQSNLVNLFKLNILWYYYLVEGWRLFRIIDHLPLQSVEHVCTKAF